MKQILELFQPNKELDKKIFIPLVIIQLMGLLVFWCYFTGPLIPKPLDILNSWLHLARSGGLIQELYASLKLCFNALWISILVAITFAYLTIIPFFKTFSFLSQKTRFLPITGFSFVFSLTFSGYDLKVALLVWGMSSFLVESMIEVVKGVNKNNYNHARTIFGNEWRVVFERVVLGTLHDIVNVVKQNFAIVWTLLTCVEGLVRSDGGIGVMMLNDNKHLKMDEVFAMQLTLLVTGIAIDYGFGLLRAFLCPYADLSKNNK